MKKVVLFTAGLLLAGQAVAQSAAEGQEYVVQEKDLEPINPTFLENVYVSDVWAANWFVSVKGGMSAFIGTPVGHGDFFDRKKPMLNASVGKWFTPYVGGRLAFQGLRLKDSEMLTVNYQNVHADFLYNIATHFKHNYDELPKWDLIPYAGCGIIRNTTTHNKPFAMSYGVMARYRLASRLHVAGELGMTTTFRDFDGPGKPNKFGDHLLQASVGLDITIGNVGWKRVIDPKPYVYQNDVLIEYLGKLREENARLDKMHKKDAMALLEMRKILEIEGLLDKYDLAMTTGEGIKTKPKNNYSGINSLRARLRNKAWNGDIDEYTPILSEKGKKMQNNDDALPASPEEYFQLMKDGKIYVGAPIFFFFNLATDQLTEKAQVINIKEIASAIRKYGLHARIVGAADSQTGSAYQNEKLSERRAAYISKLLQENGVVKEKITTQHRGGISTYEPQTGNRNTCVMLYFDNN